MIISVKLSRRWGAGAGPSHREELRAHLGVSDLSRVPVLSRGYVSVSHTINLGGYATGPRPLGFDLEVQSRVNPKVAVRVSTMEEFARAPSAAHLWCAKEAAFKALYHFRQPKLVSEIEIDWRTEHSFFLVNAGEFGVKRGEGRVFDAAVGAWEESGRHVPPDHQRSKPREALTTEGQLAMRSRSKRSHERRCCSFRRRRQERCAGRPGPGGCRETTTTPVKSTRSRNPRRAPSFRPCRPSSSREGS